MSLIGVGGVLGRILGKAIDWIAKNYKQDFAGPLQTATGVKAGGEAAIHSIHF